jgi:hypothetical protein
MMFVATLAFIHSRCDIRCPRSGGTQRQMTGDNRITDYDIVDK